MFYKDLHDTAVAMTQPEDANGTTKMEGETFGSGGHHMRSNAKSESDVQIHIDIKFQSSSVKMKIATELLINYPTPSFMSLPITLYLTGASLQGRLFIAE